MDVVNQFGGETGFRAQEVEHRRDRIDVLFFIECHALKAALGTAAFSRGDKAASAVAFAELDAHMTKAVSQRSLQSVETCLFGSAALVIVDRHSIMRFAAQKFV